jgi:DNA-binding transcriptional MerR regulator
MLHVSPETVRLWERSGHLRALRTEGGVRLFDRRDVERLAREREADKRPALRINASKRAAAGARQRALEEA